MRTMVVGQKVSRRELHRQAQSQRQAASNYLRTLAALLVEADGEIRIHQSTYAMVDGDWKVKASEDPATKDIVLTLVTDEARKPVAVS